MKRIVVILTLILAFCAVTVLMASCEKEEEKPTYQDYTITVTDGMGIPMSQVMIKITTPTGDVKTRITDKEGIATLNNVVADNYDVVVEKGFSNAVIINSEFQLTADVTSLNIIVHDESKIEGIYGQVPDGTMAYNCSEGSYNIPVTADNGFYAIFQTHLSGIYKVSIDESNSGMTVGYYGIPMFVQSNHLGESEYDGRSFELIIQDTNTPYIIGIFSEAAGVANLTIERVGDAPFDPEYAPWTVVPAESELTKCDLPDGAVLTDLDITDPALFVKLGEDGYYYTADGKLVYLRIGSVSSAGYLDASIALIAGLVDPNVGQVFGGYVYDDNGNYIDKYSYNSMLESYYGKTDETGTTPGYCDSTGVYPLTEELAEAVICHGNSVGWWRANSGNYLFDGVNVVVENAWLFLCCTVD